MRIVKCDNCENTGNMDRAYYTTYPKGFKKVELDKQNYEFCSKSCELNWLIRTAEAQTNGS